MLKLDPHFDFIQITQNVATFDYLDFKYAILHVGVSQMYWKLLVLRSGKYISLTSFVGL